MKSRWVLVLYAVGLLSTTAAWAQGNPVFGVRPDEPLRQFLQLTDAQTAAIDQSNRQFHGWIVEKFERTWQVQAEIATEIAKTPLDPLALGVRYAEIETICRETADRAAALKAANVNVLTDGQKLKLKTLEEALDLFPYIAGAQSLYLLGSRTHGVTAGLPLTGVIDLFGRTDGTRLGLPGTSPTRCQMPPLWIESTSFLPVSGNARALPSLTGRPANETHYRRERFPGTLE